MYCPLCGKEMRDPAGILSNNICGHCGVMFDTFVFEPFTNINENAYLNSISNYEVQAMEEDKEREQAEHDAEREYLEGSEYE